MKQFQITVQAIVLKENQVLLMKRRNTGFKDGFYGLPGGKLHVGETPMEGIVRELKEELGCNLEKKQISFDSLMEFDYPDSIGRVIYFNFIILLKKHLIINNEPSKCEEIIFSPIRNLPINTIEATSKSIQNYIHEVNYFEFVENGSCV